MVPAALSDPSDSTTPSVAFKSSLKGYFYSTSPAKRSAPDTLFPQASTKRMTRSSSRASEAAESPVPSPQSTSSLSAVQQGSSARASPTNAAHCRSPRKSTTISSKPKKTPSRSSGYAPPSRYAHLPNLLTDALAPDLICVFIGVNPGLKTAATGHAYAHPSNLFWKLLHSSGCTPRRCLPSETYALPQLYGLGNTNIVTRATANAAELSREEMDAGVAVLESKVAASRPEAVAIVGKGIWESIWRVRHARAIKGGEFRYGWQDDTERMGKVENGETADRWEGARVFVATSTSGLAAGLRPAEKEAIWRDLGEWVEKRREERGLIGTRRLVDGVVVEGER